MQSVDIEERKIEWGQDDNADDIVVVGESDSKPRMHTIHTQTHKNQLISKTSILTHKKKIIKKQPSKVYFIIIIIYYADISTVKRSKESI